MKKIIFLLSLGIFASCQNTNSELVIERLNEKVDQWHLDASEANFDSYFGFIAEDGIFIGTDVSERWSKEEFAEFSKPYFDRGQAWSFTKKERIVRLNKRKDVAWFDEVLDTWMGDCRSTGVLSLKDGEWKLDHYQLSVTIDNELMAQFLEITKSTSNE